MRHSLVFKTLTVIIFILIAIFSAIGWYIYESQSNIIQEMQLNQKEYIIRQLDRAEHAAMDKEITTLRRITSSILGAITESLYNMDEETVKATLNEFMQNENIKAVYIYDSSLDKSFLNGYKENSEINFTNNLPSKFTKLKSVKYKLTNVDEEVGYIEIYYNNEKIIQAIADLKESDLNTFNIQAKKISKKVYDLLIEQIIFFSISGLIIAIIITFLLIKFVNTPLKKLKIGLDSFFLFLQGKQDFTKQIEIPSNDEFGQMASSLNENISVSARLHEELNALYTDLEHKVEIRTQELAEINSELQDSIEYASTIQKSFLKDPDLIREKLSESFVIWQPRDKVGGDLYIYEESAKGVLFGVVDCTGHSVPGGFMTMLAGSIIKKLSTDFFDNPAKLLRELNIAIKHQLSQDKNSSLSDDGLDMGLCFINKDCNLLKFAGAKLDLLYFKNGEINIVKANRQSIGYRRSKNDYEYTNHELHLDFSESFYLYTDGITDQIGGDKNFPLGNKKFKEILSTIQNIPIVEQEAIILDKLAIYQKDNSRRDDITVISFKVKKGV